LRCEPGTDPRPGPDDAGPPDYGGVPDGPFELEPWPILGQFLLEPEPEPEPVDEFDVELVPVFPEFPVVVDVVAALATRAPPATRPDVSAPAASTLRRRICMVGVLSVSWRRPCSSR
jgi:hypothetical protein